MPLVSEVTLRTLSLGSQDPITGWYHPSFTNSTIDAIIAPKGWSASLHGVGLYARYDKTMWTPDPVKEGDEIYDAFSEYHEVKSIQERSFLDSFLWRECELVKLPIHYDMPAYGTGGTVQDARQRIKGWLDGNMIAANLTKGDGATLAPYITAWANPPYDIARVFVTKGIYIAYCIGEPVSTDLADSDHAAYGYAEKVPVEIYTIDRTDASGLNLYQKAYAELRRIARVDPVGSKHTMERGEPNTRSLGSTTLYSVKVTMDYQRGTTL